MSKTKVYEIPSQDHLYRRVTDECFDPVSKKCTEGAFLLRPIDNYLSVDWAERTNLKKSSCCPTTKKIFKITELSVEDPKNLGLAVEHKPTNRNKAHSGISGDALFDDVEKIIVASLLAEKSTMQLI